MIGADGAAPAANGVAPNAATEEAAAAAAEVIGVDGAAPGAGDRARLPVSAAAVAAVTTAAGGLTARVLGASSSQTCVWRQLSASKPGVSSR